MKSIKPGRAPSMMGAVMSLVAALFGLIWTLAASEMGAPGFFPLFGLLFMGIAIASAVYQFSNATRKNRFSAFDITEDGEEPDPLQARFEEPKPPESEKRPTSYCPYCGEALETAFAFCPHCGKKQPENL